MSSEAQLKEPWVIKAIGRIWINSHSKALVDIHCGGVYQ